MVENLGAMILREFQNIKELTDFEDGLRFALHRLQELKTLQFEFMKNPFYLLSENELTNLGEAASEESESITKTVRELNEKLLALEQSEINTRLYYEKL